MGGIQQENNDDNLTKHSFGLNACELQDGLRNMGQKTKQLDWCSG